MPFTILVAYKCVIYVLCCVLKCHLNVLVHIREWYSSQHYEICYWCCCCSFLPVRCWDVKLLNFSEFDSKVVSFTCIEYQWMLLYACVRPFVVRACVWSVYMNVWSFQNINHFRNDFELLYQISKNHQTFRLDVNDGDNNNYNSNRNGIHMVTPRTYKFQFIKIHYTNESHTQRRITHIYIYIWCTCMSMKSSKAQYILFNIIKHT